MAKYPTIKGLTWHTFEWPDGSQGEIYGPDPDDPLTIFAVALQDLGTCVTAGDLDVVAAGFFEAIEQLPDAHNDVYRFLYACHLNEQRQRLPPWLVPEDAPA
jgi:hypothetical protein